MVDPNDAIPLGHDGYLKLWALRGPKIRGDFILVDEAQDTNPVVLDVLQLQSAQLVYVGDRYQQIYEWRGAVNAMESVAADRTCYLTMSFRFGQPIADFATRILRQLGEGRPLRGDPSVQSKIGMTRPNTILARTNAGAMTAIIEALNANLRPHLVGGKEEMMGLLRGVADLKDNRPSTEPMFFGFQSWAEVLEFVHEHEDDQLTPFVNLVVSHSERQLMWALNRTVEEDRADLVISTAHKSKGREWDNVRLLDDFHTSTFRPAGRGPAVDPSEARLFYVAATRARRELEVPAGMAAVYAPN